MGKKIEDAEVKKECPSCGLGVALDASICEFCGWDFDEEDEWILQIEKLERDLMLEKQRFEPGTVGQRIELTLHTPALERIEMIKAAQTSNPGAEVSARNNANEGTSSPSPSEAPVARESRNRQARVVREAPVPEPIEEVQEKRPSPEPPGGLKVRRVRTAKPVATQEQTIRDSEPADVPKRTRTVRKVKQG